MKTVKTVRTVLITGSSRGIGRAIALKFAKDGCNLVLNCSKNKEELNAVLAEIESFGVCAIGIIADVSVYSECERMVSAALERFGQIDILVNNAGSAYVGLFTDMSPEQISKTLGSNQLSAINCSHLVVPQMVQRKSGAIVNISSMWGSVGASCEVVYSSAKGGLDTFTKALAKELGPSGIRVNAVSCGVIETGMNAFLSAEETAGLADQIPLSRFGTPQEIAEVVAFLASDSASYITGQIIAVDGGVI